MKLLSTTFILAFCCIAHVFATDSMYSHKVVFSEHASPDVRASAQALAGILGQMTGQPFELVDGLAGTDEDAIQLWTGAEARDAGLISEALSKELKDGNMEAFAVESSPNKPGLKIIAGTDLGLRHGVYWVLRQLGYVSLFPGAHWQIVPKRSSIRLTLDEVQAPLFRQREFFGTGGYGSHLPLDPDGKIKAMWDQWRAVNLFGASVRLGGHYGESFVRKHKAEFEAHPEYRAMLKGERVPMSVQFQLNYGNKDLRELYIQDRINDMRTLVESDPTGMTKFSVSVDPADGGGHDESPESKALGSISDRVFGLANEVAKRINEEFPGNYVNLYAYNEHSDVTTFPLEKNVIVSVIPYGFNRAKTLLGDDLLVAWKQKANQLGLYDYWGIPDWSRGKPDVDFIHAIPKKLTFWRDHGVRYFNAESTTGAGTAGIALFLASRMMWDSATDPQSVITTFYDQAFGPARKPMQRMLERWASGFYLQDNELGLSFRDLKEAWDLSSKDGAVRARIGDYVAYVQYLRLLREFDAETTEGDKLQAANDLMRFLWQIRDNAMVQTFRISQMLEVRWFKNGEFAATWDFKNPQAEGWASVPPALTEADQLALLEKGLKDYPVFFETKMFSNNLVPLGPVEGYQEQEGEVIESFPLIKGHHFIFQSDRDQEIEFSVKFGERPEGAPLAIVNVHAVGDDKHFIFEDSFVLNGNWHTFKVPVKKGIPYQMMIQDRVATFQLKAPKDLPLVVSDGVNCVGWTTSKAWFYVPKGTKRFAILIPYNPIPEKLQVWSAEGEIVEPLFARNDFTVYEVPEDKEGKVWQIDYFKGGIPMHLFNVPDNLSFSPNTLMVPKE